jgi:hypothetical protein
VRLVSPLPVLKLPEVEAVSVELSLPDRSRNAIKVLEEDMTRRMQASTDYKPEQDYMKAQP